MQGVWERTKWCMLQAYGCLPTWNILWLYKLPKVLMEKKTALRSPTTAVPCYGAIWLDILEWNTINVSTQKGLVFQTQRHRLGNPLLALSKLFNLSVAWHRSTDQLPKEPEAQLFTQQFLSACWRFLAHHMPCRDLAATCTHPLLMLLPPPSGQNQFIRIMKDVWVGASGENYRHFCIKLRTTQSCFPTRILGWL